MGLLTYTSNTSLDGFVADASGSFAFSFPDEEVLAFINDLERPVGTYLFGRRLYEVMAVWDDPAMLDDPSPGTRDFAAQWRETDKVVYSTTLAEVSAPRTRLERTFDPQAVRDLVQGADAEVGLGGPTLAAAALAAGLVDEVRLLVRPVLLGGGLANFPLGVRTDLELVDERRFASGVVHVHYRVRR